MVKSRRRASVAISEKVTWAGRRPSAYSPSARNVAGGGIIFGVHIDDTVYRYAFESARAELWLEDVSRLRSRLLALSEADRADLAYYIDTHPQFVHEAADLIEVIDVNTSVLDLYGVTGK